MNDPQSDTVVPKDELLPALADVENMSGEEAARSPGLDDGRQHTDDSTAAPSAPTPPRSTSDPESTPAPESDGMSHNEAEISAALEQLEASAAETEASSAGPGASETAAAADEAPVAEVGSPPAASGSLGDEQLRAASAELETISSSSKEGPSPPVAVAKVRSDGLSAEEPSKKPVVAEAPGDAKPQEEAPAAGAPAKRKRIRFWIRERLRFWIRERLRFWIGKRSASQGGTESRPPGEAAEAGAAQGTVQPVAALAKCAYHAVDRALDRVNRPFAGLDDTKRALLGWAALTTLIISILVMVLVPIIRPHRDAITFLHEKRARLDAPPPADGVSDSTEADD